MPAALLFQVNGAAAADYLAGDNRLRGGVLWTTLCVARWDFHQRPPVSSFCACGYAFVSASEPLHHPPELRQVERSRVDCRQAPEQPLVVLTAEVRLRELTQVLLSRPVVRASVLQARAARLALRPVVAAAVWPAAVFVAAGGSRLLVRPSGSVHAHNGRQTRG
jgi:hypothetical protein